MAWVAEDRFAMEPVLDLVGWSPAGHNNSFEGTSRCTLRSSGATWVRPLNFGVRRQRLSVVCLRYVVRFRRFGQHLCFGPLFACALHSSRSAKIRGFVKFARFLGRVQLSRLRLQVLLGVRRNLRQALHRRRGFGLRRSALGRSPNQSFKRTFFRSRLCSE